MKAFLDFIAAFLKQYWPGLAVAFFTYEEDRVDHETKEKEAAQLAAKNLEDEKTIRDKFNCQPDQLVIDELAGIDSTNVGIPSRPSKPKSD